LHAYFISRDVDDIDLFPGAMAERPVSGGLVGPTFACILAQQFSNLRKGNKVLYIYIEEITISIYNFWHWCCHLIKN
jgi:hypothetical protein